MSINHFDLASTSDQNNQFYGACLISDTGLAIPITECMVQQALDLLMEQWGLWHNTRDRFGAQLRNTTPGVCKADNG